MARKRLTITLDESLLSHIDNFIDGAEIRNRSHAIEYLLKKSFSQKISQALILAGGQGLRMRPFTYELPKCMLPIAGRPLMEHIIDLFRSFEIRNLFISIGHLGEKIKDHFGNGSRFGVRIQYIEQGRKGAETARAVLQAQKYLEPAAFVLYYGDVLADIDISDLIEFHTIHKALATMAITSVPRASDWGVVELQGMKVVNFQEKPEKSKAFSHLINAGIYVLNSKIFDSISEKDKKLEISVLERLSEEGKLYGYSFRGKWFDVGTPQDYERAVKEWKI